MFAEIIGYILAVATGFIMGLIGGGGSILSVPIFVYLFKMDAVTATTLSLFVVGVTSIFGAAGYYRQRMIRLSVAFIFGITSVISVVFTRRVILPNIPEILFEIQGFQFTKDILILVLFAILMIYSSIKMIQNREVKQSHNQHKNKGILVIYGLMVGLITGLIGAGGGFLIVPALVLLLNFKMKEAVGTSLMIIAMNAMIGFVSTKGIQNIDWKFIIIFSSLAIIGAIIGLYLTSKIQGKKLKPLFGWFILIIGVFILLKELILN